MKSNTLNVSDTPFTFKITKEERDSKVVIVTRWDGELTAKLVNAFIIQYLEKIEGLDKYYSILDLGSVVTSTAARELIRQSMKMVQIGIVKHALIGHTPRQRLMAETFLLAKEVSIRSSTRIFQTLEEAWEFILAAD
jgi:hypothetical protein